MKIIAHRGNISGPNKFNENTTEQIDFCIKLGYDVEIDLWYINGDFYLGHDNPDYKILFSFLVDRKEKLWIHCKNQDALFVLNNTNFNYFWHETDTVTITSHEFIWAYPNKHEKYYNNLIVLDFSENVDFDFYKKSGVYGVCVDYIEKNYIGN